MVHRALNVVAALALGLPGPGALAAVPYAPDVFVREDVVTDPVPSRFSVCHGGTCHIVTQTALEPAQWAAVRALFQPPARDAAEERGRIARAVALLERLVGEKVGTADDRAENRSGADWAAQMDCIDESTNSTTYLRMMAVDGLLRWHRVEARVTRGFFLFGWPHTTAVIAETGTGDRWAVDSWFHDNGREPEVVPLAQWRAGWRPPHTNDSSLNADAGR